MLTRGTQTHDLSDANLRTYIAAAALDIYEAVIMNTGDYELLFAFGTLERFVDELDARATAVELSK